MLIHPTTVSLISEHRRREYEALAEVQQAIRKPDTVPRARRGRRQLARARTAHGAS